MQTELNMLRSFENSIAIIAATALGALLGVGITVHAGRTEDDRLLLGGTAGLAGFAARLDAVIDAANRANVTTYAIDAHGLRMKTAATTLRRRWTGSSISFSQLSSGSDRTNQPLTMASRESKIR